MKVFSFVVAACLLFVPLSAKAEEKLTYYMDYETALKIVPKKETEYFSKELGRDFTNWPIPWEEQVRNAITNAGNSANPSGDVIGGKKYWVPFDEIPGEDKFPTMKRITLSAQRGYQKAIIHDYVELDKMQAEFSAELKAITDKHRAESEKSLQEIVDAGNELKAEIERDRRASEAVELKILFYEGECKKFFADDAGGCGILANAIVQDKVEKVMPIKSSSAGEKLRAGDVFVVTPKGRFVARDDQGGWVQWYKYDNKTANVVLMHNAIFE